MRRIKRVINESYPNNVIGEILGGLGNQLFVIFTTISYALDNNSIWKIKNVEKKRKTYWGEVIYKNVPEANYIYTIIHQEPGHGFSPIPFHRKLTLRGYFQSYKYFDHNKDKILNLLGFDKIREDVGEKYKEFLNNDGFIHFRLGDYKNLSMHPVCSYEYYHEALKRIDEKDIKILYFFEEEDMEIVTGIIKKLEKDFPDTIFNSIDTKILDYEQVFIMSHLKYCIIANSTFSWWGAYFNKRDDKKVFYPEKWFSGILSNLDIRDTCLLEWNKIS